MKRIQDNHFRGLFMRIALVPLILATAALSAQRPITNGGTPRASPDGKWIAFQSNREGASQVYVVRPDGEALRKLLPGNDAATVIGWSGDSREVFITRGTFQARIPGVQAVSIENGAVRALSELATQGAAVSLDGRTMVWNAGRFPSMAAMIGNVDGSGARLLTDSAQVMSINFAFSPDGRRLAYTNIAKDSARRLSIIVANADGSNPVRVATNMAATDGSAQWPAWSPDGKRIAIQSGVYDRTDPAKNTAHVWVIDVASGVATRLAAHERAYLDETPTWVNNDLIAFQSDRTGRLEIWVMKADGSGARQITK